MKILNARTGQPQSIPFNLGEAGRARRLEEVKISNRPGQEPEGPESVGFFVFGQEQKHVILTKNSNQAGVLVRINTNHSYTRGANEGKVELKGGKATLLTKGYFADGDAGGLGSQSDELWHVEEPTLFLVHLSGGAYKGAGWRYLIVTEKFNVFMFTRDELAQLIATDENPEVSKALRPFAVKGNVHADIRAAYEFAEKMEDVVIDALAPAIQHFVKSWKPLAEIVTNWGLAIPAVMGGTVTGVEGVHSNTLVPGPKALLAVTIGPGGGKRYGYDLVWEDGVTRLKSEKNGKYTAEDILATVDDANWQLAWINKKDGEVTAYCIADAGGVHTYYIEGRQEVRTENWEGMGAIPMSLEALKSTFGM